MFTLFWQVQQWFGQQLIFTSPNCQLTSGFCSQSQVRLGWSLGYQGQWLQMSCVPYGCNIVCSTASHTSNMLPASFSIPSTLYTGMGQLSFFFISLFCCTKLELTKWLVALQSRRPFMDSTMLVSAVSIKLGFWGTLSLGSWLWHIVQGVTFPILDVVEVANDKVI